VRKIITFHSTIDDCTSFVEAWNGTRSEDDSLFAVAIHSRMSPAKRALALAHFAREKGCILSNPHLLSEGINVPSTDMAVLLCNMQSPIRVAQILGRVLRKDPANPRKRVGYLMVPIFASDSGEVADVQEEAALGPLWDVLECLLEQTEGFEKLEKRSDFEAAINDMMENVEFIDPWGEIQRPEIDRLRERISVRWVERLTTRWDDQFEELRRFKDAYGHAHVTAEDGKTSKRVNRWHGLAGWARRQRDAFEGRTLRADRQRRLEREGFVFRSSETTKDEANRMEWLHLSKTIGTLALPNRYGLLPAPWAHRHLTCEVVADLRTDWPEKYAEECERFALICQWAARIRRNATSAERQQLLGLGFIFNAQEALAKFRTQNDRVEIPVWLEHLHTREKIIYPSTV
jgi:superfamily II DNA/RNA helicase